MAHVLSATYEHGVFTSDQHPGLAEGSRVRLVIQALEPEETQPRDEAWSALQRLWQTSPVRLEGDRLTRDQLGAIEAPLMFGRPRS